MNYTSCMCFGSVSEMNILSANIFSFTNVMQSKNVTCDLRVVCVTLYPKWYNIEKNLVKNMACRNK